MKYEKRAAISETEKNKERRSEEARRESESDGKRKYENEIRMKKWRHMKKKHEENR